MRSEFLLTVAIPTYNGANTIGRTLQSVLSQQVPGVEVIVLDNCSEDGTAGVVARYLGGHACLKYFRSGSNLGFDRNVDQAMRRAQGDFVWLLGDDDVILPGGVREVLAIAAANPECCAVFADCPHSIKLPEGAGGVCRSGDDFFRRTRFKNGFLSTNVFNRKVWAGIDVSRYFGTGWIHIGFLIEALLRSPSYVAERSCVDYIRDDIAGMRWGGQGGFIETGLRLVRLYGRMSALPYSRETRRQAYWSVKGGYWRNIPLAKAKGFRATFPLVRECAGLYKGFFTFWAVDLPLLLCPGVVFRLLYRAYRSWKSRP